MADKIVKVVDRNGKEIVEFQKIPNEATVEEFKKILIKECAALRKKGLNVHRVRLTLNDARGPALADKQKTLHDYSTE